MVLQLTICVHTNNYLQRFSKKTSKFRQLVDEAMKHLAGLTNYVEINFIEEITTSVMRYYLEYVYG